MTEELKRINIKYNDSTYEVFPFITKDKIHIIRKGLYRKDNAKFRGVTAIYDELSESYMFPLYGMYHVPEDIVIVPEGVDLSTGKKTLYNSAIKAGFIEVNRPPTFTTVYFPENSPEAKAALANRSIFHCNSKDDDTPLLNTNTTI